MRVKIQVLFVASLLFFSACKKENPSPHTNNTPNPADTLVTYTNYPDNYLKLGNYWVYNIHQFDTATNTFVPSAYNDSVFVERIDLSTPGDTFYQLTHIKASQWGTYSYAEYWKITPDGLCQNRNGEQFSFIDLPVISDSAEKAFKGGYSWTGYTARDTVAYIKTDCCELASGIYTSDKTVDDNSTIKVGNITVYFARGIGITKYTRFELWNGEEEYQLLRFHLQM